MDADASSFMQLLVPVLVAASIGCFVVALLLYRRHGLLTKQEHSAAERHRSMREEFERRQKEQQELFAQEEDWLQALFTELRARGIDDFAPDLADANLVTRTGIDDELNQVLGQEAATPATSEPDQRFARQIWHDEPQWHWPEGTNEFEFVHLPTGARGSLCRSHMPAHFPAWHVSANLPRPDALRQIPMPRTFAGRSGPDWSAALRYSRVPCDQPEKAVYEAKQWLLAALRGDIEVSEGRIVPTPLTPGDFTATDGTKYWRNL